MNRLWNLGVWLGFLMAMAAFLSYYMFFARFPVTRDFPWVNLLLFAGGGSLLMTGIRRAFREPQIYRGKISGSILGVVSLLIFGIFAFLSFYFSKQLPASAGAPRVGGKAPEFTLVDTNGKPVTLAELLAPPAGADAAQKPHSVMLIFYRGYW